MRRSSLISSRRRRAVCYRPAPDTRLLLLLIPFPDTVFPSHPTPGDGKVHRLYAAHLFTRSLTRLHPFPGVHSPRHTPGAMARLCRVPGGHRAPGLLPRRFPRNSPIPRRREGGYARPTPNGRERLGFTPPSGLPRLPPRRIPFTQRRQRVRAPISPNGRALPAHGQAAKGNSLSTCPLAGMAQAGPPARAPWSRPFHRLPLPLQCPLLLNRHSGPLHPSFLRRQESIPPEQPPTTPPTHPFPIRHSRPRSGIHPVGRGRSS